MRSVLAFTVLALFLAYPAQAGVLTWDGAKTSDLATGANGYVLTASAGAVTGLQWLPSSGGGGGGAVSSVSSTSTEISVSPTTGDVVVSLGTLSAGDIPNLSTSKLTSGTLPVARGGTNSGTALVNGAVMVSSGGAVVESPGVTATGSAVTAGTYTIASNGHVENIIASGSLATNVNFTLPATQGSVGNVLTSGGAGAMTWGSAGVSTATLNTNLEQQTTKRRGNLVCLTDTTPNGSQTCDGTTTPTSAVVYLLGNADPTQNGPYLENDFGAWARTADVPDISALPGSIFGVNEAGGGVGYADTAWFAKGDGSSTSTFDRVPHGCASQNNVCASATTCAVTCSTAVNTPVMTGGGCSSTANLTANYPSAATTWTCNGASGNITAYAICCN